MIRVRRGAPDSENRAPSGTSALGELLPRHHSIVQHLAGRHRDPDRRALPDLVQAEERADTLLSRVDVPDQHRRTPGSARQRAEPVPADGAHALGIAMSPRNRPPPGTTGAEMPTLRITIDTGPGPRRAVSHGHRCRACRRRSCSALTSELAGIDGVGHWWPTRTASRSASRVAAPAPNRRHRFPPGRAGEPQIRGHGDGTSRTRGKCRDARRPAPCPAS